MASFYGVQLIAVVATCFVFFLLERRFLQKNSPATRSSERNAPPSVVSRLSWQYLWVFAIIMGERDLLACQSGQLTERCRCRLAARTLHLLRVSRATRPIGTPRRSSIRPRILNGRCGCTVRRCLGRPIVSSLRFWRIYMARTKLTRSSHRPPASGRKRMCMVFCLTYILTCILIQFSSLPILFVGRLLGGFSTAILLSTPESWLVASANNLSLSSRDLSAILGRATLVNSVTAAVAGIASNKLVERTDFFSSTFLASASLLLLGLFSITFIWSENRGAVGAPGMKIFDLKRLSEAWGIVRAGESA